MNLGGAVFVTAALMAYAALIYHAVATRGRRIGIGFFAFAAIVALVREFAFAVKGEERNAYQFHFSFPVPWLAPLAVVGWSITAYLAWCVAEAILSPWPRAAKRLFATLAVAFVAAAAISLAVEPTGVSVRLWTWRAFDIVKVRHPRAILITYVPIAMCWALFSAQILGSHWFFFGSSRRRDRSRYLAALFLVVPRAITLIIHELSEVDNHLLAALRFQVFYPAIIVGLACFVQTTFDWPQPNGSRPHSFALPLGVGAAMVVVLLVIDYGITKRQDIALSKAPLFLLLAAGIWSVRRRRQVKE